MLYALLHPTEKNGKKPQRSPLENNLSTKTKKEDVISGRWLLKKTDDTNLKGHLVATGC